MKNDLDESDSIIGHVQADISQTVMSAYACIYIRPQGPKRAAASPASGRAEPGERCSRPSTCCSVCSEMKREGGPGQTRTPRRAVGQGHTKVGRRGLGVPPPTWAQEEEGGAGLGAGRTARNTLDWRPSRHHGPQVRLDTNSRGEHEATACDRMRG